MGGEHLGAEHTQLVQVFQWAAPVSLQRAFDGGEVFVDVALEHGAGVRAQCRDPAQHCGGGGLGDRHGQRRVDQTVPGPAGQVGEGPGGDGRGVGVEVVAHLPQHAADAGVGGGGGDGAQVDRGAGAGVGDCGEPTPQGLQRGQLHRQVGGLVVEAVFQRNPDPAEDFRGFPEGQGLAEGLREVVVGVDEAGHHQVTIHHHRGQVRALALQLRRRADLGEHSACDEGGVAVGQSVGQGHHLRDEQHLGAVELGGVHGGVWPSCGGRGVVLRVRRWAGPGRGAAVTR